MYLFLQSIHINQPLNSETKIKGTSVGISENILSNASSLATK